MEVIPGRMVATLVPTGVALVPMAVVPARMAEGLVPMEEEVRAEVQAAPALNFGTPALFISHSLFVDTVRYRFSKKGCCLPSGGVPSKPAPPKDTECPDTHYWGNDKGCCLPSNPPGGDQPQCPNNWSWNDDLDYCQPPTSTTPPSQPSHGYGHHNKAKRDALKSRSAPLCPLGLDACPIPGMEAGDYECMDTSSDLEACGGCPSLGQGQDCTAIEGAWNVACEERRCIGKLSLFPCS